MLLGIYEHRFNWKWQDAERHFQAALAAQSNPTTALHMYGNALALRKDPAGVSKLQEALMQDPDSLQIRTDLALAYLYYDKFSEARRELDGVFASDPQFFPARWALGELHLRQKDYPAAVRELRRACDLDPDSIEAQAELAFCLGKSATESGTAMANDIIETLKNPRSGTHVPPTALAVAQLGLAKPDNQQYKEALKNLQRGVEEHDEWLAWLAVDPVFNDLRGTIESDEVQAIISR